MIARRRTERWRAGAVVCAALLVGGGAAGADGLTSGSRAGSGEARDQPLLTSSELPAGSSPVEVSEDRIADGFATAAGTVDWSTTAGPSAEIRNRRVRMTNHSYMMKLSAHAEGYAT
ncbi:MULTISPECIES: hypothetical protein [unclassified Nocardia]|uniref:hypothetical protein n=1 Tax=unclassified Nocardia TaxID=2637762 RepID=UPI0033A224D0